MPEQTPAQVLDAGEPNRLGDALRRISLGNALTRLAAPVVRSLASTPAVTIAAAVLTFPRPVLAILGMTATVGGVNQDVRFRPIGSALGALVGTADGAAAGIPHAATVQVNAQGNIVSVTFSAAPTVPFALVIEAPTDLPARIGAAMS